MMEMWRRFFKAIVAPTMVLLLLITTTMAFMPQRSKRVRFAKGTSGTSIHDGIARGEYIDYFIGCGRGQTMRAQISSAEHNATFTIYYAESGTVLPDAEEVTEWEGTLPSAGDYVIRVQSARGGSSFTVNVGVD